MKFTTIFVYRGQPPTNREHMQPFLQLSIFFVHTLSVHLQYDSNMLST